MAIAYLAFVKPDKFSTNDWNWVPQYVPRSVGVGNIIAGDIVDDWHLIAGDSTTNPYRTWIEVVSYRFDLSARAGENSYGLSIKKPHDRTTPQLALRCANKDPFQWAVLEIGYGNRSVPTRSDTSLDTALAAHTQTLFLKDVQIGNFLSYGEEDAGGPTTFDEVLLTYSGIAIRYDTGNDGNLTSEWEWQG